MLDCLPPSSRHWDGWDGLTLLCFSLHITRWIAPSARHLGWTGWSCIQISDGLWEYGKECGRQEKEIVLFRFEIPLLFISLGLGFRIHCREIDVRLIGSMAACRQSMS